MLFALPWSAIAAGELEETVDAIPLSPYEVTARTVEFKRWIKISSPCYLIYTDASVKETIRLLRRLETLRFATRNFLRRNPGARDPAILVLPTAGSDWRKIASKGSVEWRVAISYPASEIRDLVLVQYDWRSRGEYLLFNYVGRVEFGRMNLPTSFWFWRGIGHFFETATVTNDRIKLGWANSRSMAPQMNGWLPWERFFQVDETSPEFVQERSIHEFDGQCAVFVQYLLTHPDPIWTGRLHIWNALLDADREPTEALFKKVFGHDWKSWQKTIENYMDGGTYNVWWTQLSAEMLEIPVDQMNLPVSEMRELFVVSQILNQEIPDSEASLDALLGRGLKTEELRPLLAEACLKRERKSAALELLRTMIAAGSTNPNVHALAASLQLEDSVPDSLSLHARLDAMQAQEVRRWCEQALALDPRHELANEQLAWTAALGDEVTDATVREIAGICRTLEGNGRTDMAIAALAVARWRTGQHDSAKIACHTLLGSWFCGDKARAIAHALWQELDPATPPPMLPSMDAM